MFATLWIGCPNAAILIFTIIVSALTFMAGKIILFFQKGLFTRGCRNTMKNLNNFVEKLERKALLSLRLMVCLASNIPPENYTTTCKKCGNICLQSTGNLF